MQLQISQEHYDQIVEHARADKPYECCGIVSASGQDVVKVYPTKNARPQGKEFSFEIDSMELYKILEEIESDGLQYAIYHSHTRSAPKPSLTDLRYAKLHPNVLWIIVGLADAEPEVRTWRINDGAVSEAELVVK